MVVTFSHTYNETMFHISLSTNYDTIDMLKYSRAIYCLTFILVIPSHLSFPTEKNVSCDGRKKLIDKVMLNGGVESNLDLSMFNFIFFSETTPMYYDFPFYSVLKSQFH